MPGGMNRWPSVCILSKGVSELGVAEVIGVAALGNRGTGGGFHADDAQIWVLELFGHEGQDQAAEVAAATDAADQEVGLFLGQGELFLGLQADHRLMQKHVIEHAPQRVLGVGVARRFLNGLGDGNAQRARAVRIVSKDLPARLGLVRG